MIKQFCKSILQIKSLNPKTFVNLVIGFISLTSALSLVKISEKFHPHGRLFNNESKITSVMLQKLQLGHPKPTCTILFRKTIK